MGYGFINAALRRRHTLAFYEAVLQEKFDLIDARTDAEEIIYGGIGITLYTRSSASSKVLFLFSSLPIDIFVIRHCGELLDSDTWVIALIKSDSAAKKLRFQSSVQTFFTR